MQWPFFELNCVLEHQHFVGVRFLLIVNKIAKTLSAGDFSKQISPTLYVNGGYVLGWKIAVLNNTVVIDI